jgi:hypothetical protein
MSSLKRTHADDSDEEEEEDLSDFSYTNPHDAIFRLQLSLERATKRLKQTEKDLSLKFNGYEEILSLFLDRDCMHLTIQYIYQCVRVPIPSCDLTMEQYVFVDRVDEDQVPTEFFVSVYSSPRPFEVPSLVRCGCFTKNAFLEEFLQKSSWDWSSLYSFERSERGLLIANLPWTDLHQSLTVVGPDFKISPGVYGTSSSIQFSVYDCYHSSLICSGIIEDLVLTNCQFFESATYPDDPDNLNLLWTYTGAADGSTLCRYVSGTCRVDPDTEHLFLVQGICWVRYQNRFIALDVHVDHSDACTGVLMEQYKDQFGRDVYQISRGTLRWNGDIRSLVPTDIETIPRVINARVEGFRGVCNVHAPSGEFPINEPPLRVLLDGTKVKE